jgi:hypothetical protein
LRPAQANSSRDLISIVIRAKWIGGVLCEALSSSLSPTKKKKALSLPLCSVHNILFIHSVDP